MDIIERFFWILGFKYDNGKRCECGEHKECVSKIQITGAGVMSRTDIYKCSKFQEQLRKAKEIYDSHTQQVQQIQQQAIIKKLTKREKKK